LYQQAAKETEEVKAKEEPRSILQGSSLEAKEKSGISYR